MEMVTPTVEYMQAVDAKQPDGRGMSLLETLPAEIQWHVFSYLIKPLSYFPFNGQPRNIWLYQIYSNLLIEVQEGRTHHPLNTIAASSQSLYAAVEHYCQHLALSYPEIIKARSVPSDIQFPSFTRPLRINTTYPPSWPTPRSELRSKSQKSKRVSYRAVWLSSVWRGCLFCKRTTQRRAIFDMLIWTCKACDKDCFGHVIPKTDAWKKYKLKPLHFLCASEIFKDVPALSHRKFTIGTHYMTGVSATLFLEDETKELAALLQEHDPDGARVKQWRTEQTRLSKALPEDRLQYARQVLQIPLFQCLIREMEAIAPLLLTSTMEFKAPFSTFKRRFEKNHRALQKARREGRPTVLCEYSTGGVGLCFSVDLGKFVEHEGKDTHRNISFRWQRVIVW